VRHKSPIGPQDKGFGGRTEKTRRFEAREEEAKKGREGGVFDSGRGSDHALLSSCAGSVSGCQLTDVTKKIQRALQEGIVVVGGRMHLFEALCDMFH